MQAQDITALHVAAFGHDGAHGWHLKDFAKAIDDPSVVISVSENGYAIARVVMDEAELLLIATRPTARRKGIASKLLRDLETSLCARAARRLFLEVHEGNGPALAFYERLDFKRSGLRPGYYGRGPGHAAILMEKPLKT